MLGSVLRSRSSAEASQKVVTLVGILDRKHGSIPVTINGRREKRCSIVQSMTCEEHFLIADHAYKEFFEATGQVFCVALDPRGKNPTKPVPTPSGDAYAKVVEEALAKIDGTSISKADYDAVIPQIDAAAGAVARGEIHKAIEALQRASKTSVEKLRRMAEERLQELDGRGDGLIEEARQLLEKDPAKAKEILRRVASQYPPLACAKKAEELLKSTSEKGR
jgi:hypothetical protein